VIRRAVRRSAGLLVGVLACATLLTPPATASDVTEAERAVADLGREVEIAAEDYNEARENLQRLQTEAEAAEARAAAQAQVIAALEQQMVLLAVEAFKNGGIDTTLAAFFTTSPGEALLARATVDALAQRQGDAADELRRAQERLEADRAVLAATVAEVVEVEAQLAATKAEIEQRLADAEETLAAAQAAAEARAAAALAASRSRGGGASSGGGSCGAVQAPDDRVAAVLAFACSQLGKPYRWGATGPDAYDCSGFTSAAWAVGGVSLPHSSRMQYSSGVKVDRSQLQAGDLVYAYSPISHVGIYLGDGRMIHAPTTGDVVKISPLGYFPYVGATRPGG
jgi:cell wall-associated NlpC family hydrolase